MNICRQNALEAINFFKVSHILRYEKEKKEIKPLKILLVLLPYFLTRRKNQDRIQSKKCTTHCIQPIKNFPAPQ